MDLDSDGLKSLVAKWTQKWDSKDDTGGDQALGIVIRPGRLGIGAAVKPDIDNSVSKTIKRSLKLQCRRREFTVDRKSLVELEDQECKYSAVAKLKGGSAALHDASTSRKRRRRKTKKKKKTNCADDAPVLETSSDHRLQSSNMKNCSTEEMECDWMQRMACEHKTHKLSEKFCGAVKQETVVDLNSERARKRRQPCLILSYRHPLRWRCVGCRRIKMGCITHQLVLCIQGRR